MMHPSSRVLAIAVLAHNAEAEHTLQEAYKLAWRSGESRNWFPDARARRVGVVAGPLSLPARFKPLGARVGSGVELASVGWRGGTLAPAGRAAPRGADKRAGAVRLVDRRSLRTCCCEMAVIGSAVRAGGCPSRQYDENGGSL
jgi:hypothetical protein